MLLTPERIRLMPILLGLGFMVSAMLSYWLVRWFLPRYGWQAMWQFRWRFTVALLVVITLWQVAKVVLMALGLGEWVAALS